MTAYDFVLIWAIGATFGCIWLMQDANRRLAEALDALKLANETLRKWKGMIDKTIDGKGKFVRVNADKIEYVEK